jgi:hypothetical protein
MAEAKSEGSAYEPVRNRAFKRGIEHIRNLAETRGDEGYDVVVSRHHGVNATATLHPKFGSTAGRGNRWDSSVGTLMWDLRNGRVTSLQVNHNHRVGGLAHLISQAAAYSDKIGMTGPIHGWAVPSKLEEIIKRHGMDKPFEDDAAAPAPCPHCGK